MSGRECPPDVVRGVWEGRVEGSAAVWATLAETGVLGMSAPEEVGGMSMGGYVLFNLLERYPARISGAMFLVTRAAADDEVGKQKRNDMIDAVQSGEEMVVSFACPGPKVTVS